MKSINIFYSLCLAATVALTACNSAPETKKEEANEVKTDSLMLADGEKVIYECPMHPEIVSDKPAACSKCGMDLERKVVKDSAKTTN